jgi:two-component system cell cycle response regulator DivK
VTKILVVEDNADNMKLFRWTLEDEGYQTTSATSGEESLETAQRELFDLVIMDISLPGIDGKDAARRLRMNPEYAKRPILAATAHAVRQEENEIRRCGFTDMITKPIDEFQLVEMIERLLAGVN